MSTLRRRLLVYSAPVALVLVIAIVKLFSVVVIGNSAAASFADRDTEALAGEVGRLELFNVVDPGKATFAEGTLAVLEDRLADAERNFADAAARLGAAESCSAMVNLELVRETLGDRANAASDSRGALGHYLAARDVVQHAPDGCFAGNADADPDRRDIRNHAQARLDRKISSAGATVAPNAPPPPPAAQAPPPGSAGTAPTRSPDRLDPASGDPLDRLQQILRDAARG
ncbi:hypothetical protein BA059_09445 [Mycolicibacterium sp. (ex Dasyatis americana)]|uniref:hypothetical protein n=1 Tax=unclassified Mycobacterium TaxID=2642494 RepID=UPI0008724B14|nr:MULTISPECIES: hypothetical protein [unclassified Mycobacterium]MCG7610985.1 hypothetical protein [Mycobacterium sp. CnD-18-1]OFB40397.1 hypothetical protein BA059_09445 [Mycolicibacterium sp. (ex Dasyatis americana)]